MPFLPGMHKGEVLMDNPELTRTASSGNQHLRSRRPAASQMWNTQANLSFVHRPADNGGSCFARDSPRVPATTRLSLSPSLLDEGEHVGDALVGVGSGDMVSVAMQHDEP
jgi:hypothetical protein